MAGAAPVLLALLLAVCDFRLKAEATEVPAEATEVPAEATEVPAEATEVPDPPGGFRLQAEGWQEKSPAIDGRIGEQEWAGARREKLTGGGELLLLPRADVLFIAVRGPRTGLASICAAKGKSVRILHASAAIGEATFERWGDMWMKRKEFEWTLRDSPRGDGRSDEAKAAWFAKSGWIANASAPGSPEREFKILAKEIEYLGVTFLATDEPMAVSFWPSTMTGDCRSVKIPQGYLPDTARFDPTSWYQIVR